MPDWSACNDDHLAGERREARDEIGLSHTCGQRTTLEKEPAEKCLLINRPIDAASSDDQPTFSQEFRRLFGPLGEMIRAARSPSRPPAIPAMSRSLRLLGANSGVRTFSAIHKAQSPLSGALCFMARPERFELPTPRFEAWCSIQLSYGRQGRKTRDTQALSQAATAKTTGTGQ